VSLVAERTGITGQRGRRARPIRRSLAAFAGFVPLPVLAVGLVVNLAGFVASVIPASPFDAREPARALPYPIRSATPYRRISPHNGYDEPILSRQ